MTSLFVEKKTLPFLVEEFYKHQLHKFRVQKKI